MMIRVRNFDIQIELAWMSWLDSKNQVRYTRAIIYVNELLSKSNGEYAISAIMYEYNYVRT